MNKPMRYLTPGVIGGMGPAATLDFISRILNGTPAKRDQDHLRLIVDSNPGIPDRNLAIRGEGVSPGPVLATMAKSLVKAGADFLVMPCNTAHAFRDFIKSATSVPFIDMIEETTAKVKATFPSIGSVGVLAADGCIAAELYQKSFHAREMRVITPSPEAQKTFMSLLYSIKGGDTGSEIRATMQRIALEVLERGAQCLVAGCTEVPLVIRADDLPAPLINSTDVLVERTIAVATGRSAFPRYDLSDALVERN